MNLNFRATILKTEFPDWNIWFAPVCYAMLWSYIIIIILVKNHGCVIFLPFRDAGTFLAKSLSVHSLTSSSASSSPVLVSRITCEAIEAELKFENIGTFEANICQFCLPHLAHLVKYSVQGQFWINFGSILANFGHFWSLVDIWSIFGLLFIKFWPYQFTFWSILLY